jgi:hypothetical protein
LDEIPYGLNTIVFGGPKIGKSTVGGTTPPPRLIIDAEGGSRFIPGKKIRWNPLTQPPPDAPGPSEWKTAVVTARKFGDVQSAFDHLSSGKHPFKSVTLDSVSEIQQRVIDDIAGRNQMTTPDWGNLLRTMSELIRSFRDLVTNPVNPLEAVVFIAMAKQDPDTKMWKPYAQGQLATTLPYYVDVCAYLAMVTTETGERVRRLFVDPVPGFETGERVGGHLGPYIDNANISAMLATVRAGIERTDQDEKADE